LASTITGGISKRIVGKVVHYAIAIIAIVFFAFPLYWLLTLSFKTRLEVLDPSKLGFTPTLDNYLIMIRHWGIDRYLWNSLAVTLSTIVVSLAVAVPAAYSLARFDYKGKESLAFWMISLRMLPAMSAVIPFYLIANLLNLFDTHLILVVAYMTFNVPFSVWMLRGFFAAVPRDYEEAAMVDGVSRFGAFLRTTLRLASAGVAATAILCFIQSWNEFALALFLTGVQAKTLPPAVTFFMTSVGVKWGELSATGVVVTIPVLIFALLSQRYLVRGLTLGALK